MYSESGVLFNKNKTDLLRYPMAKQGDSYAVPDGVETIGTMAFSDCAALKSVTVSNSVKTIGSFAFANCGLASVTIGSGVTEIKMDAFEDCGGLTSITSLNPVPPAISRILTAFDGVDKAAVTLYVPKGSAEAYKSAIEWKTFSNIVELNNVSVSSRDRVIPASVPAKGTAVITPAAALAAGLTAGPNIAARYSGSVGLFRSGSRATSAALYIYDASGSAVKRIVIRDDAAGTPSRRQVGSWDLADKRGRAVSAGTYLVKGTIKTSGGKTERVSAAVDVR